MHVPISTGCHAAKLLGESNKDSRAVQDAAGNWHISDTAYVVPNKSSCSSALSRNPPLGQIDPKQYPNLFWAQPFMELRQGEVHTGYTWNDDGTQTPKPISQLTDCIELEARGISHSTGDYEIRQYHYRDGRLWARDVRRYAYGKSLNEWIEFDGDQQLLFYSRSLYDHGTKQEDKFYWNRLEHEAYPDEVQAASVEWGIEQAITEAQNVLEIVR